MNALLSFKQFLQELSWPEESFAAFLHQKVAAICADRFQEAADVYVCVRAWHEFVCVFVCLLFVCVFVHRIEVQVSLLMAGKGSTPLSYSIPPQFFTMINTLVYLSSQVYTRRHKHRGEWLVGVVM